MPVVAVAVLAPAAGAAVDFVAAESLDDDAGAEGATAPGTAEVPGAGARSAEPGAVAIDSDVAGAGVGAGGGLEVVSLARRSISTTTPSRKTTRARAKNMITRLPTTIWLLGSP